MVSSAHPGVAGAVGVAGHREVVVCVQRVRQGVDDVRARDVAVRLNCQAQPQHHVDLTGVHRAGRVREIFIHRPGGGRCGGDCRGCRTWHRGWNDRWHR